MFAGLFGPLVSADGPNDFLARSIYVPDHDLLGLINENLFSTSIYNSLPRSCFHKSKVDQSRRYFTFYRDTASFYSSIATMTSLVPSLESDFSLQATLKIQSKNIAGSRNTISGNALVITAKHMSFSVEKSCLVNEASFTKEFLEDLQLLPKKIESPWLPQSWQLYMTFLTKYGSHVLSEITTGSEIDQRSFAQFSESYTEREFQVKSCLGLAGPTEVGLLGIKICEHITDEEKQRVSKLSMTSTLTANGGTSTTRNKILTERTKELIDKFLNEANESLTPIRYKLTSVWDVIKQTYLGKGDNFIRGINLEAFYLGFLNYGCRFQTGGGQNLQQFTLTKSSTPGNPEYECTLAPEGCHSDEDCHYHPIWCNCQGESCVGYNHTILDTGKSKTMAYINHDRYGWAGCGWKVAGFTCRCAHIRKERLKVWPSDGSRNEILYQAHNQLLKYNLQAQDRDGMKIKEDL